MSIRRVLAAFSVVAVAAACGTDGGGAPISAPAASEATTSPAPTVAASSTDAPITDTPADGPTPGSPSFPQDTAPQTAASSSDWDLVLTDVRVAQHESFDRIVLEFSGTGPPGWSVNYVNEAVLDGTGDSVTLDGDSVLDIYASHTTWPASDYYGGPRHVAPLDGGDVTDVYVGGTFEGYTQVLAGIDGARVPFRVFALTDPSRLVVDVVDDSD